MSMRRLILILFALTVCVATGARADYSEGGAFRLPGYGARAWGMGGAAIATVDDESAVSWNPAMLSLIGANTAGASYINLIPGATARQSQVAYAHILQRATHDDGQQTYGRHVVGAMYTNLSLELAGGENYSENFVRLAYAYAPDYFVSFAIAGDLFFSDSDIPGFDALGSSVDFAARLTLTEHIRVAAVARNAFSRYSFDKGQDFRKQRAFVFGASTDALQHVTVEGNLVFDHGDLARTIGGFESDYFLNVLAIRAGYALLDSGESRGIPYFGFGLRAMNGRFLIHYNANLDDDKAFEDTHRFSLSVSI